MFSGLVQARVRVEWIETEEGLKRYAVTISKSLAKGLVQGASVAIGGVCQTVVRICAVQDGVQIVLEAIQETLERTTLGIMGVGSEFNFERSLRWGDEVGGHLVSGHVFGKVKILQRQLRGMETVFLFSCESDGMRFLFEKGFVALDGTSLTLVQVDLQSKIFSVHCIPETLKTTTWCHRKEGDWVNIEWETQTQAIVLTLERMLAEGRMSRFSK